VRLINGRTAQSNFSELAAKKVAKGDLRAAIAAATLKIL